METQLPRAGTLILALSSCAACEAPVSEDSGLAVVAEPGDFTSRLIPISREEQPQWDQTATIEDRMKHYRAPGVSIGVIDGFEILLAIEKEYGWPMTS